jgi:DNA modification methylase
VSSTEQAGSGGHPSAETASRTGDSLSCSCEHYRIVTEQISHFATFPEEIPTVCILAGSRPGDVVIDPFNGAGTVGVVCAKTGREYIGIELNPAYVAMAEKRIYGVAPLFNQV